MLKQEQALQALIESSGMDSMEKLSHILIPACALGPEILRQFRIANPSWRPRSSKEKPPKADAQHIKSCSSCRKAVTGKVPILEAANGNINSGKLAIPQTSTNGNISAIIADGAILSEMKVAAARPVSMSFEKDPESLVSRGDIHVVPLIQHSQVPQGNSTESNINVTKVSHLRSMKSTSRVEAPDPSVMMMNGSLPRAKKTPSTPLPEVEAQLIASESSEHAMKSNTKGELYGRFTPQHLTGVPEMCDSGRINSSNLAITPEGLLHDTGAEALEDTMPPSQMQSMHVNNLSPTGTETLGISQFSKSSVANTSLKVDDPILVDDKAFIEYIVATRNIPNGESLSTLDDRMQKNLLLHYKNYRPLCPHCNSNMYVKFRYFNNSSKSSLLQPRYTCRNPDTCLTIQEKTGKAGSRDFTLPKPKDTDNYGERLKTLPDISTKVSPTALLNQRGNVEAQGKTPRQPQMIAKVGSKRALHGGDTPIKENFEKRAKLPSTTLSLQSLNGSAVGMDPSGGNNQLIMVPDVSGNNDMRIVEVAKARTLIIHASKAMDDANGASSTSQAAGNEQLGIDVKCQAAGAEIGRLIVQPISVQALTPVESGSAERSKGKITEVNIRMFIDLSNTSPC